MSVSRRRLRLISGVTALGALAVMLGAAATPAAPASASQRTTAAGSPGALSRFIVRLDAGADTAAVRAAVEALGGRWVAVQPALGTVVVELHPSVAQGLTALPEVRAVSPDREVQTLALGFDPVSHSGSMTNVTKVTGAQDLWRAGVTGTGVDIAVIDSGVAPVPALKDSTKVVVGPDLSFESQDPDLRYLDTYGHGTHMAGIIAGRETAKADGPTYAADTKNFYGMAPDARLLNLKLADHDGAVDVSQIIAAIDWVVQNQWSDGLAIRVLNLSFGTRSTQRWQDDPLSWAAEVAWHQGIVVVAAAGNDGATPGLSDPAYNPWLIAVGAADTKGTLSPADDVVPAFSARQGGIFPDRGIDVVAPGVGIIAPGVPGSALYESYPGARIGNGFLRGSGTSQSAAVVSGAAALLLSQRGWGLTPDDVKKVLMSTATPLAGQPVSAQGAGEINLAKAMTMNPPGARQYLEWGNGAGALEKSRGDARITMDGITLQGEVDIFGMRWDSGMLSGLAGGKQAWTRDGTFNGSQWLGGGFAGDTVTWAGKTWSGKTWSGKTWTGKTWSGKTWTGKTWSSAVWTGTGWSSASWPSSIDGDTALMAKRWAASIWR
jgi:serine protease AprX